MKSPDNRETTDRNDMMCTRCNTEGLEPHPAYIDEYDGRYEILKATRCPNENCDFHKKGVPEDKIQMQMPEKSLAQSFKNSINRENITGLLMILGGIIFMMFQVGILPPQQNTETVNNTVDNLKINIQDQGGNFESYMIYNNTTLVNEYETNNNTITVKNLSVGSYVLYPNRTAGFSPPGKNINITNKTKEINITNIPQANSVERDINQSLGDATLIFNYSNPNNTKDLSLNISPIPGETVQREWKLNTNRRDNNILMPAYPESQKFRIDAPLTTRNISNSKTYQGRAQSYTIFGNREPDSVQFELVEKNPNDTRVVESFNLASEQEDNTKTINVRSNSTLGNASIILKNGTYSDTKQSVGVWEGQENISIRTGVDGYIQDARISVRPEPINRNRSINGIINNSTVIHNFEGNSDPKNVEIKYEGGDSNAALVGDLQKTVSGENGTTGNVSERIVTVQESGTYRVIWDYNKTQNGGLVNFWYKKGSGNKVPLNFESDVDAVDLKKGQKISLVSSAKRKTISPDKESPGIGTLSSQLEVVDLEFRSENPQPNQNVDMYLTIKNNGGSTVNEEISLYQNGDTFRTQNFEIPGGSKVTFGPRDIGIPSMGPEGTNVWFVDDRGPFFVEVGDSEPTYGVGNINIELRELGSQGKVNLSVNNKSICKANASGGTCKIDNIKKGENKFEFNQSGVVNTSYTINYNSVENPEDIDVDISDDGILEFNYDGILNNTTSKIVEIPPNSVNIGIESSNQVPVGYTLSWDSNSVINGPIIDKSGEIVVNKTDDTFIGPRKFNIGSLEKGNHTFRFRSAGGGYVADIVWNERQGQNYPNLVINSKRACSTSDFASGATCETSVGTEVGTNTLKFSEASNQEFNYRVSYKAEAVANNINISVNDQLNRIFRPDPNPEPWASVKSTDDFQKGKNNVSIDIEDINNIQPKVNAYVNYTLDTSTIKNPNITLVNGNGTEYQIDLDNSSIDNGRLINTSTIDIPSRYLTVGKNKLKIELDSGVYNIQGSVRQSNYGSVEYDV